jgi:membrane-associated protease RseP (regulator of RpoE activity)
MEHFRVVEDPPWKFGHHMEFWFLILLLSFITYFIVQRSVAGLTRTPVWLLWLVMMTPAFIWTGWIIAYGVKRQMPLALVVIPFIACPLLYWFLLQKGRISPELTSASKPTDQSQPSQSPTAKAENAVPRLLDQAEEANLQNCFPWSVYYLQNIEYRPQAVLCKGQLRAPSEEAYQTIRDNITRYYGDRFLVVFQEGLNGKPFFALVPNPQLQKQAKSRPITQPGLALLLLVMTLFTTTQAGVAMVNSDKVSLLKNPELLQQGLPYALALMAILGVHELGHYLMTRHYRMQATLPYFLPVPFGLFQLGTLGAFIQIRSPIPNRRALFDVGIAGPIAGLLMTIPALLWGLAHSQVVPFPKEMQLFTFEAINPSSSILLVVLSKLMLGQGLTADQAINLNPVAIAGYLGLLVTALNLMPVGQLDGGHIVHAMYGQQGGAIIGQISRLLFLLLALIIRRELLPWAILLFLIPAIDEPALNNVTELDNRRDLLGLISLVLLLLIILPAPKALTAALL